MVCLAGADGCHLALRWTIWIGNEVARSGLPLLPGDATAVDRSGKLRAPDEVKGQPGESEPPRIPLEGNLPPLTMHHGSQTQRGGLHEDGASSGGGNGVTLRNPAVASPADEKKPSPQQERMTRRN